MSRQREPVEDVMDSFYCNWSNKGLFSRQSDDETGNFSDSPIGVMVAEMSSIYYVIGKGYVLLPGLLFPILTNSICSGFERIMFIEYC